MSTKQNTCALNSAFNKISAAPSTNAGMANPFNRCLHLPASSTRKRYILIFVDLFTRYPEAFALLYVNGTALGNHLVNDIVCRHGCPSQILCDNASYNVKGYFKQVCDKFGIKLSPVLEYHPEANGVAESKVKALKSLLRSLVQRYDDWEDCLPESLFAYRASFQPTISASPFYLNHGREAVSPTKLHSDIQNMTNSLTDAQHNLDLISRMGSTFKFTSQNLERSQAKLARADQLPSYYNVGDHVNLFLPVLHVDESIAFKKYWKGPYVVISKINPVIFRIKRMNDDSDVQDVYANRLKKAYV